MILSVVVLRTASTTALTLDGKTHLAAPITGMWVWCVPPVPGTLIQSDSTVGPQTQRGEWRSLSTMSGAVFVAIIGVTTRFLWLVDSLGSPASSTLSLILIGKCGGLENPVS